jgi:hypothetical protein
MRPQHWGGFDRAARLAAIPAGESPANRRGRDRALLLGLVEFLANRFDCAGTIRRDWPPAKPRRLLTLTAAPRWRCLPFFKDGLALPVTIDHN